MCLGRRSGFRIKSLVSLGLLDPNSLIYIYINLFFQTLSIVTLFYLFAWDIALHLRRIPVTGSIFNQVSQLPRALTR